MTVKYKGYNIYYDAPPVPMRAFDWHYVHEDYDGPGDPRFGHAPSLEAAKKAVDEETDCHE